MKESYQQHYYSADERGGGGHWEQIVRAQQVEQARLDAIAQQEARERAERQRALDAERIAAEAKAAQKALLAEQQARIDEAQQLARRLANEEALRLKEENLDTPFTRILQSILREAPAIVRASNAKLHNRIIDEENGVYRHSLQWGEKFQPSVADVRLLEAQPKYYPPSDIVKTGFRGRKEVYIDRHEDAPNMIVFSDYFFADFEDNPDGIKALPHIDSKGGRMICGPDFQKDPTQLYLCLYEAINNPHHWQKVFHKGRDYLIRTYEPPEVYGCGYRGGCCS